MYFFTDLHSEGTFILAPELPHVSKIQMFILESDYDQNPKSDCDRKTQIPYM